MIGAALLSACMAGPRPETLVTELRVLAIEFSTPEANPGENIGVIPWVADPQGRGFVVQTWICWGDVCAETVDGELQVPEVEGTDEVRLDVWALACAIDLCPALTEADRQDPRPVMMRLPLVGVSLARQGLWVSDRPQEARRTNPMLVPRFEDPVEFSPDDLVGLDFDVEGAAAAYGFVTAGGFGEVATPVAAGAVTLDWYTPEPNEASTADLWVVAQAEDGGVAVWTGTAIR